MAASSDLRAAESRDRLGQRYREIDGRNLRHAVHAGLEWLRAHQELINSLNVFPVPDGDTGTNMVLTMQAAWDEIEERDDPSISEVAQMVAQGALMGARGNSGVILSQLWRGFARTIQGQRTMDSATLVEALQEAKETAYKGVVRPVEGTILTVSKDIATAAQGAYAGQQVSALAILDRVVEAADASVERTPDLLPVLKDAGVVDSGGMGLFILLEGMLRGAYRLPMETTEREVQPLSEISLDGAAEAVEPGQDWEVVVDFRPSEPLDLDAFYGKLESLGTSIQVGEGEGIYRMHIHVPDNTQYEPIEYIRGLGTVTNVALENLMDQTGVGEQPSVSNLHLENVKPGQIAVVAVAPGHGIARVFGSLGAAAIIEGGQTMNPSTEEILGAIEKLPTDSIIVLPNNKNVRLAADQARELTVKNVRVVPTVSVPQGVTAMLSFFPDGDLEEITVEMTEALDEVHYGEITRATRSVEIEGVNVREGQLIGMLNGKLTTAGDQLVTCLHDLLARANPSEAELVSLYFGGEVSLQEAEAIAQGVHDTWDHLEVELIEGGQPHYHFILSIE